MTHITDAEKAGEIARKLFDGTATTDDLAGIATDALFIKAVTHAARNAASARRVAEARALAQTQRADVLAAIIVQAMFNPNCEVVVL